MKNSEDQSHQVMLSLSKTTKRNEVLENWEWTASKVKIANKKKKRSLDCSTTKVKIAKWNGYITK